MQHIKDHARYYHSAFTMFESTVVSEVVNEKHDRGVHNMNDEWSRYRSFATFPVASLVMPTRLVQAGFYYTGIGEEVICFCCGHKNSVWAEGDNVIEVHRRLSPHCRFVNGEETGNIPIHKDFRIKPVRSKGSKSGDEYGNVRNGFESKHTDIGTEKCRTDLSLQVADHVSHNCKNGVSGVSTNYGQGSFEKPSVSRSHVNQSSNINGHIELYPGIAKERPRHPDYALRSARVTSFTEWPENHAMDPSTLAAAGFFYAGLQDCVRCFFCSCGMKDWEYGDSPWVEHASLSPECAYVKLCKGNAFVNVCRAAINSGNLQNVTEVQLAQENIPDDWLVENINSVAAKLVLSNGYSQMDVEKGVLIARQKYGSGELKTQFIIEYLNEANVQPSMKKTPVTAENRMSYQTQVNCERTRNYAVLTAHAKNEPTNVSENSTDGHGRIKSEKQLLLEENRRLKDLITCKICMDNDACIACLPCGHLASCIECSKDLKKCAICRTLILGTVRVYQA